MSAPFFQSPPRRHNSFTDDTALQLHLERLLPVEMLAELRPGLTELGARAVGELAELGDRAEATPPRLVPYGPWGDAVDQLVLDPAWSRMLGIAAELGLVAAPYERRWGAHSRLYQLALMHLFSPTTATAACPLAMTDGCARSLQLLASHTEFGERAFARLTSRDPAKAWTAGQWMTEKEGGSDVGRTATVARRDGDTWRLYGTKFFTSATTAQCALTLARPEGSGPGSRPLTMFYVEAFRDDGSYNHIHVRRLKDKLGTRALPTAELELEGSIALPVGEIGGGGVRQIATLLNTTRFWNASNAVSLMQRAVALACDYARRREAFGRPLIEHPLHAETLARIQVEVEGGLALVMRLAQLMGRSECGEASQSELGVLRLLTPLAKLFTGKQAVAVTSEALECFGGAGYMEDTGLPRLLRDAQVLPIWEGTTNVLALDCLRAIQREDALGPFLEDAQARVAKADVPQLAEAFLATKAGLRVLTDWFRLISKEGIEGLQISARSFALSLARTYASALLCETAAWALETRGDRRPSIVAKRWAETGLIIIPGLTRDRAAQSLQLLG